MKTNITIPILIVCIALMSGCVRVTKTFADDGSEAYALNCSGGGLGWDQCFAKAGEKCGARGYEVISKDGDQEGSLAGNQYGLFAAQTANRSLTVKCKNL